MPDETRNVGGATCGEVISMTPTQSNSVIEEKLEHLAPVLECTMVQLKRLHADLKNGRFSFDKIWARVIARDSTRE